MNDTFQAAENKLLAHKLELAARNLQHLLKIQQEQASLENIVASLEQTLIDAHGNNPMDACDRMTVQTQILDAVFHKFVGEAEQGYMRDNLEFALRAQNQMLRTALTWKRLKTDTYMKHKIIRLLGADEKTDGTN